MPTQKKFLDQNGLIQLLQEIESLDETNIKDLYWSTDNADINPTVVFKVGDDSGSPHSIKKLTFTGETGTAPTGATPRTLTITIGGVNKTITYYDTDNSTGINYSYISDSSDPKTATKVKEALDRVITALDNLDPADEKVKQTAQTENKALPILTAVSATPTSGANAEAGYDTAMTFNPRDDELTITGGSNTYTSKTIISPGKVNAQKETGGVTTKVSIDDMHITFNQGNTEVGSVNSVSYTGKATGTENSLASTASGYEGAKMVGYTTNTTVKDAIDDIYAIIGSDGDGGDSIIERVSALEDGDNLIEGTNITLTKDTTNHTVTIAAADPTVTQTEDTTSAAIPLLLASAGTPTSPAGTKYNKLLTYNPSTNSFVVSTEKQSGNSLLLQSVTIKNGEVTFSNAHSQASISIQNGTYQFSGNSATATSDSNGNNIVNTYATKAALEELSQKWTGQFMVIKNSGDTQAMYAAMTRIIAAIKEGEEPAAVDIALFELGYIYLYPNTVVAEDNVFDEYIKVLELNGSNYTMEKIGTTDAGVDVVTIPATGANSVASMFAQYVTNA